MPTTKNSETGEKSIVLVWSAAVFPACSRLLSQTQTAIIESASSGHTPLTHDPNGATSSSSIVRSLRIQRNSLIDFRSAKPFASHTGLISSVEAQVMNPPELETVDRPL